MPMGTPPSSPGRRSPPGASPPLESALTRMHISAMVGCEVYSYIAAAPRYPQPTTPPAPAHAPVDFMSPESAAKPPVDIFTFKGRTGTEVHDNGSKEGHHGFVNAIGIIAVDLGRHTAGIYEAKYSSPAAEPMSIQMFMRRVPMISCRTMSRTKAMHTKYNSEPR